MAELEKPIALEDRARDGAKLFSPSAGRNKDAIAALLAATLPARARVLEIGSGTGEHAEAVCARRTDLSWTPGDPDPASRASIAARAAAIPGLQAPLDLDLLRDDWMSRASDADILVCINVIHIAPWAVAEALAEYAGRRLPEKGLVCLYGPFLEAEASASSNLKFSEDLKRRDARWGVRELGDVKALFGKAGFGACERVEMPANNLTLIFRRA